MGIVDLQSPGQRRRSTVELLVEPVSQPADRLRDQQRRGDGVGQWGDTQTAMTQKKHPGQDAPGDTSPDTQAPQPRLGDAGQVAIRTEVVIGRRQHVVKTSTHDSGRDGHDGDVENHLRPTTPSPVASIRPPHGHEDPGENAQRIGANRNGPDVPDTRGGTRYAGGHRCRDRHR